MNGLLCGPKQPEIINDGEENKKEVVQDLVEVETCYSISNLAKSGLRPS